MRTSPVSRASKPLLVSFALGALCAGLGFAIQWQGIELGVFWWMLIAMLAMSVTCFADFLRQGAQLTYETRQPSKRAAASVAGERVTLTLSALPWTGLIILASLGATLTCMLLVVIFPGDSKNAIAFSGLLVPVVAGILIFVAGARPTRKSALLWILTPSLPATAIIAFEVMT
ncbi:MAG: hypothetical protein AAF525_06650 [Pseudomonadota bacterium]